MESMPSLSFGSLVQGFRAQAGMSGSALARSAGIDPSYLNRIERGEREPPGRELVLALAAGLRLSGVDTDRLLAAAGHLPKAIARLGALDPTLLAVAQVLTDAAVPTAAQTDFRHIVELLARRWRLQA